MLSLFFLTVYPLFEFSLLYSGTYESQNMIFLCEKTTSWDILLPIRYSFDFDQRKKYILK